MYQFAQKYPLVDTTKSHTLPVGTPGAMASKQRMDYLAQPAALRCQKFQHY